MGVEPVSAAVGAQFSKEADGCWREADEGIGTSGSDDLARTIFHEPAPRRAAGQMPCYGAWPAEQVDLFRQWIHSGKLD